MTEPTPNERTLVLLKPDALIQYATHFIIEAYVSKQLAIVAYKYHGLVPRELVERHYGEDIAARYGAEVRKRVIAIMLEGPIIALVLEGPGAIANVRRLNGATDPSKASPTSLRGMYCPGESIALASSEGRAVRNLVHGSANAEEAANEITIWFPNLGPSFLPGNVAS